MNGNLVKPPYRIGLIGLDTGHVVQTAHWFHPSAEFPVPGAVVSCAYDHGEEYFFNRHRAASYKDTLSREYGVDLVHSVEEVALRSDAFFLSSIDARHRLRSFEAIAEYGKPVLIEKPLCLSVREAEALFETAERHRVPIFCSSSLRYAEAYTNALAHAEGGALLGVDCMGPLEHQPQLPGLFWYGVHLVELLFTAYGTGCVEVTAFQGEGREHLVARWEDGRIGTIHGNLLGGGHRYFAMLYRERAERPELVEVRSSEKPDFVILLEHAVQMLRTGVSPLSAAEMLEVVRFLEAANKSRTTGVKTKLY